VLRELLKIQTIRDARIADEDTTAASTATGNSLGGFTVSAAPQELRKNLEFMQLGREGGGVVDRMDEEDDLDDDVVHGTVTGAALHNVSFTIKQDMVQVEAFN
jgi:hypothetical protein